VALTAKEALLDSLRSARAAVVWKTQGLSEYDVRRPLTDTGTNLLGLVKHLSVWEAVYLGRVFGRPFPSRLSWWDDDAPAGADLWVDEHESRHEILETYQIVAAHADATIDALDLSAEGQVPWWPIPDVTLHAILVHLVAETSRHAGHADILREQLDGSTGDGPDDDVRRRHDETWWTDRRARIERAARIAGGGDANDLPSFRSP
jgi:uncharacterized damage-inducible protein DinB